MSTLAPSMVTASEKVEFKTADQSMWSTGQALSIDESWTLFSQSFSDSFSAFDGDLNASASASAALVFNVQGDAGGISLDYPIGVGFSLPNLVAPGQQFSVFTDNTGLDSSAPHFDAKFPEFKIDLDALFSADFSLDFDSDFLGSDSVGYSYNKTVPLVSLHSGDHKSVADGFDLFLPKDYDKSLNAEQVGSGVLPTVTLDVTTPDIATVTVDLISVIEDIVGPEFPSLSGSFLDGEIDYDLFSANLEAGIAITQQFQFVPSGIDVTLTAPWGASVTVPLGQSATFVMPAYWDKEASLSASYSLQGNLVNQTGFVGTASLDLAALSGSVHHLGSFGPLYSNSFPLYDSGAIYIYNPGGASGFALDGFNTPTHAVKIDRGTGSLVAPGSVLIDAVPFSANDAALMQAAIDAMATGPGAPTATNVHGVGSGSATADPDKLNVDIITRSTDPAILAAGFAVGILEGSADGGSLTGNAAARVLAAAPRRGGSATLTAGGNELMVAGQDGKVAFNISASFAGSLAGLEAGDSIAVSGIQATGVSLNGSMLVFSSFFGDGYQVPVSGDLANVTFQLTSDGFSGPVTVAIVGPPPPPATAGNDQIAGSSGDDTLAGGDGNDTMSGGDGADAIDLGTGADVLRDWLGDLGGDSVSGFGLADLLDITGSLIGRTNLAVTRAAGMATLSAGGSSFQLSGDYSGGDFMTVTRGSGDAAHTVVSFHNYLPALQEGMRVDPAAINGVANEPFLTGDGSVGFTLDLRSAGSAYANTLGTYRVAADGTLGDVHIVFANTLEVTAAARTVDLGVPADGERIGFFLIQDGFRRYGGLPDNLSFVTPGSSVVADLDAGLPPVLQSATRGVLGDALIFHSFSTLNPADADQLLSGIAPGGRELFVGFEDMPGTTGDNDFQDVVFSIRVDNDGLLIV